MSAQQQPVAPPVIWIEPPLPPEGPEHVHRWAWRTMNDGSDAAICSGCGRAQQ